MHQPCMQPASLFHMRACLVSRSCVPVHPRLPNSALIPKTLPPAHPPASGFQPPPCSLQSSWLWQHSKELRLRSAILGMAPAQPGETLLVQNSNDANVCGDDTLRTALYSHMPGCTTHNESCPPTLFITELRWPLPAEPHFERFLDHMHLLRLQNNRLATAGLHLRLTRILDSVDATDLPNDFVSESSLPWENVSLILCEQPHLFGLHDTTLHVRILQSFLEQRDKTCVLVIRKWQRNYLESIIQKEFQDWLHRIHLVRCRLHYTPLRSNPSFRTCDPYPVVALHDTNPRETFVAVMTVPSNPTYGLATSGEDTIYIPRMVAEALSGGAHVVQLASFTLESTLAIGEWLIHQVPQLRVTSPAQFFPSPYSCSNNLQACVV